MDVRLMGSLTGLLFRAREVWMSRDLRGFSFPVLVTFQSVKRKHAGSFYSADINCICPKKEPRSSQAKMQARPPGLAGNRGWALRPSRGPFSSSPNSTLKGVGAEVHSFLSTLMPPSFVARPRSTCSSMIPPMASSTAQSRQRTGSSSSMERPSPSSRSKCGRRNRKNLALEEALGQGDHLRSVVPCP